MFKIRTLVDLLPYSPEALIKDHSFRLRILKLSQFLISMFQEALIEFYINQNLLAFDAHVGENLCQIRACYLLILFKGGEVR